MILLKRCQLNLQRHSPRFTASYFLALYSNSSVPPQSPKLPETFFQKLFGFVSNLVSIMTENLTPPPAKKGRLEPREKRRKCAILMMYSGQGYYGMQRNPGFETIEQELFTALHKIGLISEEEFQLPGKVLFQRASKTDKNVSALGQVCSLMIAKPDLATHVSRLNEVLPPSLRVLDLIRVTKAFNAKQNASNRTYQYIAPSFAFAPAREDGEGTPLVVPNDVGGSMSAWDSLRRYRMSAERLEEVNRLLQAYVGTKNYHNFTSGRKPNDRSCSRYMLSLECSAPFLMKDMEFVTITILGQSFMLHQIRKMIGLIMAICRGYTTEHAFNTAFSSAKMDIPKAPGLGLMLKSVNFDAYNRKFGKDHQTIEWSRYADEVERFKSDNIVKLIYETEMSEEPMLKWLDTLVCHNYQSREKSESQPVAPPSGTTVKAENGQSAAPPSKTTVKTENGQSAAPPSETTVKTENGVGVLGSVEEGTGAGVKALEENVADVPRLVEENPETVTESCTVRTSNTAAAEM